MGEVFSAGGVEKVGGGAIEAGFGDDVFVSVGGVSVAGVCEVEPGVD